MEYPRNIQWELLSPWNIRIIVIIPYRSKKNPQKTSRIQRNSHHWWLSTIDAWCHMVRHMPLVVMMVMVWRTLITGHAAPGHGLSPHHHVCLPSPGRTYQTYHHHSYSTPKKMPTWRIWRKNMATFCRQMIQGKRWGNQINWRQISRHKPPYTRYSKVWFDLSWAYGRGNPTMLAWYGAVLLCYTGACMGNLTCAIKLHLIWP